MSRGQDRRPPRRRGFDDDNFEPPRSSFRPAPRFGGPPGGGFRDETPSGPAVPATVKWFNPEKGFGFVELGGGSGDAFLHIAVLERSGHAAVEPGATLQVRVGQGQKGPQVTEVLEVDSSTATPEARRDRAPGGGPGGPRAPRPGRSFSGETTEMRGTVKWYNAAKGFGFIAVDGGGKDVFVHASALERSGMHDLAEGQPVRMQVAQGQKGPEAVSISVG